MDTQKRMILILIVIFIAFLFYVFINNQSSVSSDLFETIDGLNGISIR